jgi:hypothetical protein
MQHSLTDISYNTDNFIQEKKRAMKKVTLLALFGLLTAGCSNTQPTFDPSVTEVKVVHGKQYNVPKGVTSLPHVATKKEIDFYKKSGVENCKMGDILWETKDAADQIAKAITHGDATIHAKLAKEGKIGCASPIE